MNEEWSGQILLFSKMRLFPKLFALKVIWAEKNFSPSSFRRLARVEAYLLIFRHLFKICLSLKKQKTLTSNYSVARLGDL